MSVSARADTVPSYPWLLRMSLWILPVLFGPAFAWLGFLIIGLVSRRGVAIFAGIVTGVLAITVAAEVWGPFTAVVNAVGQLTGIIVALSMNPGWLRTMWGRRVAPSAAPGKAARASSGSTTPPGARPATSNRGSKQKQGRKQGRTQGTRRAASAVPTEADRLATRVGAGTTDLLEPARDAGTTDPARDAGTTEPIDVQTATADELRELPGMTRARARRAVKERTTRGGFTSVDHFGEVVGLQPHELVRLRAAATCSPRPRAERSFGRRVDY